jgi:hypothetical protein
MKKIVSSSNEIVNGSYFSGYYLNTSLENLFEKLGQPTRVGSGDDKVQLEWVYASGEDKMITIYDWKTNLPIHKINQWNVGCKGLSIIEVEKELKSLGFSKGAGEIIYER